MMLNLGEKFGNTQKTETNEEFKRLEAETHERKECLAKIIDPLEGFYKQLSKENSHKSILEQLAEGLEYFGDKLESHEKYGFVHIKKVQL
jgi:hypothetical protein